MLRIAVCEDNHAEAEGTRALLLRYQEDHPALHLEVNLFSTPAALVGAVEHTGGFDIYLLDIIMPEMDGIALAKLLRTKDGNIGIIFLTASQDYALDAFSVRAVDYLLKPLDDSRLFTAMDDCIAALGSKVDRYTLIQSSASERMVRMADIVCVEVMGHSLCYYMAGGEKYVSKVLRISFEKAAADLIADGRFLRPHRSFLINASHVEQFSKNGFVMDNGMNIPISRLRFPQIKAEYLGYLAGYKPAP